MSNKLENKVEIEKIKRRLLPEQVVYQIVNLLTSNKLKPGDKLPTEMELMKDLNVSRPVLREALASLETLGIVTKKNKKGTFFNKKIEGHPFSIMLSLSQNDLKSLMEARIILELGLVTIAAEKINDKQLQKLKTTIDQISESSNNYGDFDKEFHAIIAESADNPIVEGIITSLLIAHNKTDKQFIKRNKELTIKQHTNIYNALLDRDAYGAFIAMFDHLNGVKDRILMNSNI